MQRAAAGSDPATHRAKRADRLACRDQAAVDATTRADVDLLSQTGNAAANPAIDRDHRASGAHIAVHGAVDHHLLSGGDQVAIDRARDHHGLASGKYIADHTAVDGHGLAGGKQVIVDCFAGRHHRVGSVAHFGCHRRARHHEHQQSAGQNQRLK